MIVSFDSIKNTHFNHLCNEPIKYRVTLITACTLTQGKLMLQYVHNLYVTIIFSTLVSKLKNKLLTKIYKLSEYPLITGDLYFFYRLIMTFWECTDSPVLIVTK